MKSKAEIQKDLDDLLRQTVQLTKRRVALAAERKELSEAISQKTQGLGEALLDNRDIAKESDALAHDRVKLEGIDAAISQATQKLQTLDRQQVATRQSYAMVDFDRLTNEADNLLVSSVDKLRAATEELAALELKFGELHAISSDAGQNIDFHDHLRAVRNLSRFLHEGLEVRLKATEEQGAANAILEARAKKGK